jgi:hypothetical protein
MHDLFTDADRERVNAQMAGSTDEAYAALLAADPSPSVGKRILLMAGMLVIGLFLALIVGAFLSVVIGSLGRIVGIAILVAFVAAGWPLATRLHRRSLRARARDEVVGDYVQERGWAMPETMPLLGSTPLLRAGDDRRTKWGIDGTLAGGRFVCGFYEYETREQRTTTDSDGRSSTTTEIVKHPFTVAMLPIASPEFRNLTMGPASFLKLGARLGGLGDAMKRVELESSEFEGAYDLLVDESADDMALRQRFTPAVQMAFIERGVTKDRVELEGDVLLVARRGEPKTSDLGTVLDVLAEAVWIRAVLMEEPAGRLPDPAPLRALLLDEQPATVSA